MDVGPQRKEEFKLKDNLWQDIQDLGHDFVDD